MSFKTMESSNIQVSIIIVNYNTKAFLSDCLKSIYEHTSGIEYEIIVSDNGSADGSLQMLETDFPKVKVIANGKNLGFGAANNRALDVATGKYIFYLNSDTILLNNAVKLFYDYFEEHDDGKLGAIGANLLDKNNNVIHSYGTFTGFKLSFKQLLKMSVSNLILSVMYIFRISPARFAHSDTTAFYTGKVDYVTGADLFLKNNDSARFDEAFFLYFEEADLQRQLAKLGKTMLMIDGPLIQHLCGGSVGSDFSIKRKASFSRIQFELSRVRFLKKYNHKPVSLFFIKLLITLIWLNPFLIKATRKYIKQLWRI